MQLAEVEVVAWVAVMVIVFLAIDMQFPWEMHAMFRAARLP